MVYFIAGVVLGTFIPMPQQAIVRYLAISAYTKVKSFFLAATKSSA